MLTINHLKKSFADNPVLTDVNLHIEQGAMTAIIGPNGCGKSTLFNLITADLTKDSGSIKLNGKELTNLKPHQIAQRGMLRKFQIPGVFAEMTVQQHLQLPFVIRKLKINTTLLQQTAEKMHIADLLMQSVKVLSTGQKQWLELAMLVLLKPTILLLDEPIAGMTATEIETTLALLQRLNTEGLTIVTIEHNMDFVRRLTDDIVVMMQGVVRMRADYQTIADDEFVQDNYLGTLYV